MKKLFANLKDGFLKDVSFEDKKLYNILSLCLILTLSVFLSFWFKAFVVVACALACACMFLVKGIKKIYILIYLLPFYNVIKFNPDGFVLCSIILLVAISILAVEFLIDILKKRKKINWIITGLFGAIAGYILIPFGPFNLMYTLKLLSTLAILYLVFVNKEELEFKTMVYFLLIGFLIACCLVPFRYVSSRVELFLPDFPAYVGKQKRFSGLTSDPNYFVVEVLLLITCLTQLYFTNKIKVSYYPFLFVLLIIGFLTVSKAYFITLCVFCVLVLIKLFINKFKYKEKIGKDITYFIITLLLAVAVCVPQIFALFGRFIDESYVNFNEKRGSAALNTFTTGRSEIWIQYFYEIISTPKNLLFGQGIGGALPSAIDISPHNIFIELLYYFGLVGSTLIVTLAVWLCVKSSRKINRKFVNFIPFIAITVMLMSLNALISFRLFILISILSYSINLSSVKENKNNQVKER